ncbi:MAG: energy-coupling factor transporter transmembrane protein EcfT [Clostridia bacterium]|nr:energy-coupling factor transporter transmembrane protein EcfT [Clostridia bacterium]
MLRDITVGRYYPADSPLHKADARTKIISSVAFAAMVFTFDTPAAMLVLGVIATAAAVIGHIPIKYMANGLKPLKWFILFTIIINLFFTDGNILCQWHVLHVTDKGIAAAVMTAYKLILIICGTSLLTLTTPPIALTDGMARLMRPLKYIRIPADDIAMMISITLRFIPSFADEAEKISKAQRARGAAFGGKRIFGKARAVIPIVVPLFAGALRCSEELALAMDARCYGKCERRPRNKTRFGKTDAVIFAVMGTAAIFLVIFQILH